MAKKKKKQGFCSKFYHSSKNVMFKLVNRKLTYDKSLTQDFFKGMIEALIDSSAKKSFNPKELKHKPVKATAEDKMINRVEGLVMKQHATTSQFEKNVYQIELNKIKNKLFKQLTKEKA